MTDVHDLKNVLAVWNLFQNYATIIVMNEEGMVCYDILMQIFEIDVSQQA